MPPSYDLMIHHHLGLGDHLVCNALVRRCAADGRRVGLFCKKRYLPSVAFMYRDVPQIGLLPVDDDKEAQAVAAAAETPVIRIGFERLDSKDFVESFYRQAGMERRLRYEGFHVERDPDREKDCFRRLTDGLGPYIFLHDDPARGFAIDRRRVPASLPVVRPEGGENIFDYLTVIERATEIHCIDSAFANLVESFSEFRARRFVMHAYAKPTSTIVFQRHPWEKLGLTPPGLPSRADLTNIYLHLRYFWACRRNGWR